MNIISIANQKGGVGKTVTTVHLGAALARRGYRVLLLDADAQHGLTTYFDIEPDGERITAAEVLLDGQPLEDALMDVRDGLQLVPATAAMERAEVELSSAAGGEVRLRRAFKRFVAEAKTLPDFVFIDCPGFYGTVVRNALLASDAVILPVNSEPASVHCALATVGAAHELGEYHDHEVCLLGVLVTQMRATNAARAVCEMARRQWGDDVFATQIRRAERINELFITGETTTDRAHKSHPVATDYEALAEEFLKRCQHQGQK